VTAVGEHAERLDSEPGSSFAASACGHGDYGAPQSADSWQSTRSGWRPAASWVIALFAVAYFAYLILFAGLNRDERRRVYVMFALFVAYATFYAGFEQGGASLNLFAERYTDRNLFGWLMPAGVLQRHDRSLHDTVCSCLRCSVDRTRPTRLRLCTVDQVRGRAWAAERGIPRHVRRVGIRRQGRQDIADVAARDLLSSGMRRPMPITGWAVVDDQARAAAVRRPGDGTLVPRLALGNNLAGQLSGEYDAHNLQSLPALFLKIFWWSFVAAAIMLLATPLIRRLLGGVR